MENTLGLYLLDMQIIAFVRVPDLQKKQQVESMRHEFSDSIKACGCVPLRQELLIICYGGTV